MRHHSLIPYLSCLFLLTFQAPAHAYLDPGNGSMLIQLILGGAAGVVVLCRMYWHKLLMWLPCKTQKSNHDDPES